MSRRGHRDKESHDHIFSFLLRMPACPQPWHRRSKGRELDFSTDSIFREPLEFTKHYPLLLSLLLRSTEGWPWHTNGWPVGELGFKDQTISTGINNLGKASPRASPSPFPNHSVPASRRLTLAEKILRSLRIGFQTTAAAAAASELQNFAQMSRESPSSFPRSCAHKLMFDLGTESAYA